MDDGQHLRYVIIPRDVMIKKHLKALLRFYEGMFKWAKQWLCETIIMIADSDVIMIFIQLINHMKEAIEFLNLLPTTPTHPNTPSHTSTTQKYKTFDHFKPYTTGRSRMYSTNLRTHRKNSRYTYAKPLNFS